MPFAPQPIQFQYDPSGQVVGRALSGLGRGRDIEQQQALALRGFEDVQQGLLESQKLQLASQQMAQRGSTMTSAASLGKGGPFVDAARQAKQQAFQTGVDQGIIKPDDPVATFHLQSPDESSGENLAHYLATQRTEGVKAGVAQQKEAGINAEIEAKKNYVRQNWANWHKAGLNPDNLETIRTAALDPTVSMHQLLVAASQMSRSEAGLAAREQAAQTRGQTQVLDQQIRAVQSQMAQIAAALSKQGYPPGTAPSELGATWDIAGKVVSGGDPDAMKAMTTYYQLQNQVNQLQQQRQTVTSAEPQTPSQVQPQAPSQQYRVGLTIQTPKGPVTVVGFDTDGHPLVEPAGNERGQ